MMNIFSIKKQVLLCLLVWAWQAGYGQANVVVSNTTINGPQTTTATHSITINPTTVINGSSGAVTFSIVSASVLNCVPLNATPSLNQNYVMTLTPRQPFKDASTLASKSTCEVMQSIQYFDGLGRPLQTVMVKGNPNATADVIQPVAYDQFGREAIKYLPYTDATGTAGSYRATALTDQNTFYQPHPGQNYTPISTPSASTAFEPSPLNRVVEQGAPGADWQLGNHTMRIDYLFNDNSYRQAALYTATINTDGSRTLTRANNNTATYNDNQLTVTVMKDENWLSGQLNTTEEYKDKDGHVVLKRTFNSVNNATQTLSTYYVYDDLGQLAFVLPPTINGDATSVISQTTLDNLGYQYQYDNRNRMVAKKIPGKGWDFMVYNQLDQVIFTQDANQRIQNPQVWTYTQYDGQGRIAITGIWSSAGVPGSNGDGNISAPDHTLQQWLIGWASQQTVLWLSRDNNTATGYIALNPQGAIFLTINYYDDYSGIPGLPSKYSAPAGSSTMTRGLLVATKTEVLNNPSDMLWSVHYYDDLGRNMMTYQQHYLGGSSNLSTGNYDAITTTYDFTNVPTTSTRKHYAAGNLQLTVSNQWIYDHMGRKLKSWEQITSGTNAPGPRTLLSQMGYNEIGQLMNKQLHSTDSTSFLQHVNYTYNERSWLTNSSAELFQERLEYNSLSNYWMTTKANYNGNISVQSWGTAAAPNTQSYIYYYDNLNRLTLANSTNINDENGISYDLMGNIKTLTRYQANILIDQLSYDYGNGNQLQNVTDASSSNYGLKPGTTSYIYDGNGNVTTDPSRSTGTNYIGYNLLNLPQTITGAKTITYTYDASGQKLRRVSSGTGNTDYISGIQYNGTGAAAPTITFIQTEEGRVLNPTGTPNYEYTLTDHLGNSRVAFDSNSGGGTAKQTDDYYAFGMEISRNTASPKNEYLYNGKEQQPELGTYDYGSRQYDPVIARWGVIDILAEKYEKYSPYAYALNNPIKFLDKDGKEVVIGGPLAQAFVDKLNKESTFQFKLVDSKLMAVDPNAKTDPFSSRLVDAINSPKSITFATTPQDENTYIDQLYTGKVDEGDLDALNGDAYKAAVLQFTGERLSLDNYDAFTTQFAKDFPTGSFRDNPAARPNYTNGQKTGLGDKANAAGHDLVAGFLKESNLDKIINFVKSGEGKDGTDAQGNKTKTYTIDYNGIKINYIEGVKKDKDGKETGNGKIQGGNVQ